MLEGILGFFGMLGSDTMDILGSPIFKLIFLVILVGYIGYATYTGVWSHGVIAVFLVVAVFFIFKLLHYIVTGFNFELGGLVDKSRLNALKGPVPEIVLAKQVFNLPENNLTYEDAQTVCKAYGGRLATYKEIEAAYSEGAEWCRYGWSAEQMALFPTQQHSYDALQKQPGHERDCGRPGINGGYMEDATQKFGANCFGYKPEMTSADKEQMALASKRPKSAEELAEEAKIAKWKKKLPSIMVSPFNYNNWSRI